MQSAIQEGMINCLDFTGHFSYPTFFSFETYDKHRTYVVAVLVMKQNMMAPDVIAREQGRTMPCALLVYIVLGNHRFVD
jgi:hypothetical protein